MTIITTSTPQLPTALPAPASLTLTKDVEHALALVLSHLFGTRSVHHSAALTRLLRLYANTAVTLDDSDNERSAPCPEIEVYGHMPTGRIVLARHGLTAQTLRDRWHRQSLKAAGTPLELDLLRELLAPELWRVLLQFIAEGPQLAAARVELALLLASTELVRRPDRRHHDESVTSDSQLKLMGAAATALMGTLVALKVRSARLGPSLTAWQQTPMLKLALRDEASTDTTAPSRPEVRLLWQRMCADIARRLPANGLSEVEAIRQMTPRQLATGGLFTPLRTRLLLMLFVVVGTRVGAIPRLRRCDFERDHRFPDGSRGPALGLRPGKGKRLTTVHWKGLPAGAADVIEAYLAYMEHHLGPFTPADTGPLLHAQRTRDARWQRNDIQVWVNGMGGKRPVRALLPRGSDPTWGFTCHTFRSFSAQLVRSLDAHDLLVRWRIDASQHWLVECLLDHSLTGMDALYGGAAKVQDRENLSAIAARVAWELLAGDAGARHVPDAESFRRGVRAELVLSGELAQLGRDVDRAFEAPASSNGDRVEQLLERMEALMRSHALVRRERQAYEELVGVERELERLRHDPRRLVVLGDDEPDELADVDLAVIEAEERAGVPVGGGARRPVAKRVWVSVQELRDACDVGAATVPRWLGQGGRPPQLSFAGDDPRNPWPADRVPVDDSRGERHRRIIVAGISETFLLAAPGRTERLEAVLATPGPAGWRREHCEAPLVKPPWLP